jgi:hypothetical protein
MTRSRLVVALSCVTILGAIPLRAQNRIPQEYKSGGFFLGCQAWTWNHFTVFEAIQKTAEAGGKVIEFFPGQKLSQEELSVTWDR